MILVGVCYEYTQYSFSFNKSLSHVFQCSFSHNSSSINYGEVIASLEDYEVTLASIECHHIKTVWIIQKCFIGHFVHHSVSDSLKIFFRHCSAVIRLIRTAFTWGSWPSIKLVVMVKTGVIIASLYGFFLDHEQKEQREGRRRNELVWQCTPQSNKYSRMT